MKKSIDDKLVKFISKELPLAQTNFIETVKDGWWLFGKYDIQKHQNTFVVYKNKTLCCNFAKLKYAVSWCIADKYNQHDLSCEINTLSQQIVKLYNKIQVEQHLIRKIKNSNSKDVVLAKLSNHRYRLDAVYLRLDNCVSLAKYWQQRGFKDEIARTRHRTSN